ncbi:hypothetical protein GMORB2_3583 [Geosmithia morbida]|uniref:C2H2-type domain-containing protein n=1 Tax=Geosmithia morbida TaxID=1094350 RepID=A0A9P4YNM6_9HYPO|nr:uncharacterized protein GMORB2_3583 [Geosmithia morbida]KAF4119895.1 hypothetical protein GMORB2_3583 [Geosmithia morbida]
MGVSAALSQHLGSAVAAARTRQAEAVKRLGLTPAIVGFDLHLVAADDRQTDKVVALVFPGSTLVPDGLRDALVRCLRPHVERKRDEFFFAGWNLTLNISCLRGGDRILISRPHLLFSLSDALDGSLRTAYHVYGRGPELGSIRGGHVGGLCDGRGIPRTLGEVKDICSVLLPGTGGRHRYHRFQRPGCPSVREMTASHDGHEMGPRSLPCGYLKGPQVDGRRGLRTIRQTMQNDMYPAEIYGMVTEAGLPARHLVGYGTTVCPSCRGGIQGPICLERVPAPPRSPAPEQDSSPSATGPTEVHAHPEPPETPQSRPARSAVLRRRGLFTCDRGCKKTFCRREHLRRHNTTVHGEKPLYVCEFCGKRMARQDNLYTHRRLHTNRTGKIQFVPEAVDVIAGEDEQRREAVDREDRRTKVDDGVSAVMAGFGVV